VSGCACAVLFAPVLAQQSQGLEERIADMEKRIARLESKAGISSVPQAAQARSQQDAAPVAYSTSVPIKSQLVTKKLVSASESGEKEELHFFVQFKNTGTRDITAIDGDLVIKNISGQSLLDFGMSTAKYIAVSDSIMWIGAVEYEPDDAGQSSIAKSDNSYLIVDLQPESIQYSDGTVDRFKKQE
jgi:hypothetical protein